MSRNGSSRPKDKHFDVRLSQQTHTAERSSKNFIVRRNDKSANTVTRTHKPPPIVSAERTLETSSQQSLTTVYFEQDFYEYIVVPVYKVTYVGCLASGSACIEGHSSQPANTRNHTVRKGSTR